jgi:hypothetical protein
MTAHFNRATHAAAPDPFTAYTPAGTPQTVWAYNGGITRRAVVVYARYMAEPRFEREPTLDELRLIVDYCHHYINAPCLVETDELRILRSAILFVETPHELSGWLWGCGTIGIAVLGGL